MEGVSKIVVIEMTEKLVKVKLLDELGHKGRIWNKPELFKHIWVRIFFQKRAYDG